jgi:magnesium chelatase family protein
VTNRKKYSTQGPPSDSSLRQSSAVLGIAAYWVHVEVDVSNVLPMMAVVGLLDAAVNESRERVRAAIKNRGYLFPYDKRVTINLAPADVRKAGPSFDLPIAVGMLIATGQVSGEFLEDAIVTGELSLDGSVRSITAALSIAIGARERGQRRLFLPAGNGREGGQLHTRCAFCRPRQEGR